MASNSSSDCVPAAEAPITALVYALNVAFAVALLTISGLFSGLNLGLMSFTDDDLGLVISGSEDPREILYAKRIRPLRKHGNLLLCTLLLGCTLVNAIIAVLLADLTGGVAGTIATTAAIVVFGEIVPQSVCSRHALAVGAWSLPVVYVFLVIFFPIAYPISLLLDYILGREISGVFTRKGLLALVRLNVESEEHRLQSGLSVADASLLTGALTYKDKNVGDVMTQMEHCFCLPSDAKLDQETLFSILRRGHTRIPIYEAGNPSKIVSLLFCKDLIGIGFERALTLEAVLEAFHGKQRVHCVGRSTKLNEALEVCQEHHVHMLIVTEDAKPGAKPAASSSGGVAIGIATMEDFLEEILQEEIVDETDMYVSNEQLAVAAKLGHLSNLDGAEGSSPPSLKKAAMSRPDATKSPSKKATTRRRAGTRSKECASTRRSTTPPRYSSRSARAPRRRC